MRIEIENLSLKQLILLEGNISGLLSKCPEIKNLRELNIKEKIKEKKAKAEDEDEDEDEDGCARWLLLL